MVSDFENSFFTDIILPIPRPTFRSVALHTFAPNELFGWRMVAQKIGGEVSTQLYKDSNTCATRVSYALNYAGSPIQKCSQVFLGADGMNYIVGALPMLTYLKQAYGTDTSNTIHLVNKPGQPLTQQYIQSQIQNVQGIFVIIPQDASRVTGFGASGHVDILYTGLSFASAHNYTYCKGGVKEVYVFILN